MLKIEHCEKCINVKDLKDHWAIAGYYCPLDCQWSGSDHHSHSLCEACGDNFKNAYIARQKYGLQRQLDAQLLRRKKDEAARPFSSYKSLKEVLAKYDIDFSGTDTIPLFSLQTHEIQYSNKHFEHCIDNILFRMKHYGSLVVDSLESMRNEYVSTILHTALHIAGDVTNKEFSMRPEYEIIGDECSGRVDYAIKV